MQKSLSANNQVVAMVGGVAAACRWPDRLTKGKPPKMMDDVYCTVAALAIYYHPGERSKFEKLVPKKQLDAELARLQSTDPLDIISPPADGP